MIEQNPLDITSDGQGLGGPSGTPAEPQQVQQTKQSSSGPSFVISGNIMGQKMSVRIDPNKIPERISALGWINLGIKRTAEEQQRQSNTDRIIEGLVSGDATESALEEFNSTQEKLLEKIDELNTAPPKTDRYTIEEDLQNEINRLETMTSEEIGRQVNPSTGKPYTVDEWSNMIQHKKETSYIRAGVRVDPYEAGATILLQLMRPDQSGEFASIPENLRKQRLELEQNVRVQNFMAKREATLAEIKVLGTNSQFWSGIYRDSLNATRQTAIAMYNSDKSYKRAQEAIKQDNFELAFKEANNVKRDLHKKDPDEWETELRRYNALSTMANEALGKTVLPLLTDEEISKTMVNASKRKKAEILPVLMDQMLRAKRDFGEVDQATIDSMNRALKSYGQLWFENDDGVMEQRFMTVDDIPFGTAFNRETTKDSIARDRIQATKDIADKNNTTKESIADKSNQTKIDVANINASSRIAEASVKIAGGGTLTTNEFKTVQQAYEQFFKDAGQVYVESTQLIASLKDKSYVEQVDPATGKRWTKARFASAIQIKLNEYKSWYDQTVGYFQDMMTLLSAHNQNIITSLSSVDQSAEVIARIEKARQDMIAFDAKAKGVPLQLKPPNILEEELRNASK